MPADENQPPLPPADRQAQAQGYPLPPSPAPTDLQYRPGLHQHWPPPVHHIYPFAPYQAFFGNC